MAPTMAKAKAADVSAQSCATFLDCSPRPPVGRPFSWCIAAFSLLRRSTKSTLYALILSNYFQSISQLFEYSRVLQCEIARKTAPNPLSHKQKLLSTPLDSL